MFLLKKKDKISKLNEKAIISNNKIKELQKAKSFAEHEDIKIVEKLNQKLRVQNTKYKIEFEKRDLDFRVDKLKEKYKELMKEIQENGCEEFSKHFFLMNKPEQEHLISFIADQMLSSIDFGKRLNKLYSLMTNSFVLSKEEVINQIRAKFIEVFDCERVTLWIYEQKIQEFHTISNFHKVTESSNNEYFRKVLKGGGIYNKSSLVKDPTSSNTNIMGNNNNTNNTNTHHNKDPSDDIQSNTLVSNLNNTSTNNNNTNNPNTNTDNYYSHNISKQIALQLKPY